MKRIFLKVAYDGTNYCGWQKQNNGVAVESVINNALSELLGTEISIIGASRTDAGVHALGNVAVFDTDSRIPGEKFAYALNQRLPEDIVIQESKEVAPEFHPRYCECNKTYVYRVLNCKFPMPMERLYAYFLYYDIDVDKMQEAAQYLVGTHDFASFCSVNAQVKSTVRTVNYIKVARKKDMLYGEHDIISIEINGNGFLYNMVRIISGTLLQVGMGRMDIKEVKDILDAADRSKSGPTAPARGLSLVQINYL